MLPVNANKRTHLSDAVKGWIVTTATWSTWIRHYYLLNIQHSAFWKHHSKTKLLKTCKWSYTFINIYSTQQLCRFDLNIYNISTFYLQNLSAEKPHFAHWQTCTKTSQHKTFWLRIFWL